MASIDNSAAPTRSWTFWLGWVLSGLFIAFMIFDGAIKLVPLQEVIDTMNGLGYPADTARLLGVISLVCTLLYAIPRTCVFGAVLLTGYLGGAIATNLRVDTPLFSHQLFSVYLALFLWAGLYLRNARLRAIFPILR